MNDLRSQRGFCGRACLLTSALFILLICNVSSGRFYCELHSEELELADGAEPSSEVGRRQNRSGCSDSTLVRLHDPLLHQTESPLMELFVEKPADPNRLNIPV